MASRAWRVAINGSTRAPGRKIAVGKSCENQNNGIYMFYDSHSPESSPAVQGGLPEKGAEKAFETFCAQLETRVDFFYFFARNPLESPDSDEFVRDLRNINDLPGR
jgi:hypothetical protein